MARPKFLGRDCELSTTGIDADGRAISAWEVTRQVLAHVDAAFAPLGTRPWSERSRGNAGGYGGSAYSIDCLRQWTPNGQCIYADMSHVEVCTAECSTPYELAAQSWSTLLVAEAARSRAQAVAAPGTRYLLAASNVDVGDPAVSWGSHFNVSVAPELFADLVVDPKRPGVLGFVTSALAAAIPFFGCGYLLPLRDGTCRYSLSARAHHITRVTCDATTIAFERGLLNTRKEAHADVCERLHLIGFDYSLASAALLAAFVQACLAAAECGYGAHLLSAPVQALHAWSFGFDHETSAPTATAELVGGRRLTLGAYVREVAAALLHLCEDGTVAPVAAPGARDLLPRIVELAARVEHGELDSCARHLDWAAKLAVLRQYCTTRAARLGDHATRLLDHDFANTDPARGMLWKLWQRGLVDPLVDCSEVEACLRDAPPGNRGWARGRLIQRFGAAITDVDWDHVELALTTDRFGGRLRVAMPDPGGLGRDEFAPVLASARDVATLADALDQHVGAAAPPATWTTTSPLGDVRRELAPPEFGDRPRGGNGPKQHRHRP